MQDEKFELKCKCDTLEDALKTDTKVQVGDKMFHLMYA